MVTNNTYFPASLPNQREMVYQDTSVGDPLQRNTFSGYSRYFWSSKIPKDRWNELVWVNRWYNPDNDRSIAPVQRHKFLEQPSPDLDELPLHWTAHPDISLKRLSRSSEEHRQMTPGPSLRCGDWSTLRQMLPLRGHYTPSKPPKWGTDHSLPPLKSGRRPRRFGHINSAMTNYVDDAHLSDRLFRIF